MKDSKPLWVLTGLVILLAVFLAGYSIGTKSGTSISSKEDGAGYRAGLEAARQKIRNSGILPPEPSEVRIVNGTVSGVSGNLITISALPITANPLEPQGPSIRAVTVTDKTVLKMTIPLTNEEFQKAIEKYNAASRSGERLPPPSPYREVTITLADIRNGMGINVTADKDIRLAETFTATTVTTIELSSSSSPSP